MSSLNEAQQEFNRKYVTSRQIAQRLGVTRTAMFNARQKGMLPNPIYIEGVNFYIWERDAVEPYVAAWEKSMSRASIG